MGDWFGTYVGVQGLLALGLVAGYILAPFFSVALPEGYTEIALLILGFYFAKNGVPVLRRAGGTQ